MDKKIIAVAGYLAAGKSTFAAALSKETGVPCFIKDTFKTALCGSVEIGTRERSSLFSAVTFDAMLYVTERMFETGAAVIIEGNFVPAGVKKKDEAGAIRRLIEKYGARSFTFKFTGDTKVLYKRFIERDRTPERGAANMMFSEPAFEDFDMGCRNLGGFDIGGETLVIDGTDFGAVDFNKYFGAAREFLK